MALAVAQPDHALLQDRVLPIPERDGDAQALLRVAKSADSVLAPTICAAGRVLMGEVAPGVPIGAVVFAHRAPLAFAHIGPPFAPGFPPRVRLVKATLFRLRLPR